MYQAKALHNKIFIIFCYLFWILTNFLKQFMTYHNQLISCINLKVKSIQQNTFLIDLIWKANGNWNCISWHVFDGLNILFSKSKTLITMDLIFVRVLICRKLAYFKYILLIIYIIAKYEIRKLIFYDLMIQTQCKHIISAHKKVYQ